MRFASQYLIDMIPTTINTQRFARYGPYRPDPDAILPRIFRPAHSESKGFYVKVDVFDPNSVSMARWVDIWAAVVAIDAMCVRDGAAGLARVAGGLEIRVDRAYTSSIGDVSPASNDTSAMETS